MRWIPIGNTSDIPQRGARCVETPIGRIAIFRTADDRVFALDARCVADRLRDVLPHVCSPTYTTATPHPIAASVSRLPVHDRFA